MSDDAFAGGAPAPAEPVNTPAPEPVSPPQPLGTQTPVAEKPEAPKAEPKPEPKEPSKSAGEAVRKAMDAVKAKEAEKAKAEPIKADAKPEAKPAPNKTEPEKVDAPARREDGKFAPKEQPANPDQAGREANPARQDEKSPDPSSPYREAPSRFSTDAKAAWETAPEPIKAEVHRALRELEQGHQKYKGDSEAYEPLRQFAERAKQSGTDLPTAVKNYTEMEDTLRKSPIAGLEMIMRNLDLRTKEGRQVTLHDLAAHVLNQKPEERQTRHESTIAQLQSELATLKQQVGGVTQTFQQQQSKAVESEVAQFAKDHPRFDELSEDIAFFLQTRTKDLSEAYELAERLNPASGASKPEPATPANVPAEPLSPAGSKSISGAPSAGSDPTTQRKPASSTREALERALRRTG